MFWPPHQLHGGTGKQLLLLPPLVPPPPPLPPVPAFPPWPPAASATPLSDPSAQSTVLHPQDVVNVWHFAPAGQATPEEDRASPETTPIRVYPPGQASMLQQRLELLELPPAPALAVDLPPWLALPPVLVTPPEAGAPPEPPSGASTAEPPAPATAPVLPSVVEAPASGDVPNSCVPPPQLASSTIVIKLTVRRSQGVVVIMSRLVGGGFGHSHGPSRISALRRAR